MDTILVHSKRSVYHGRLTSPPSPTQFVSVTAVPERLGTTFPANQVVRRLLDLKILGETTGHARHRRFCYDGCMKLLEEGTEP